MKTKQVLLTSVCRPLGERYGDSPSVGYELLYGQVTRAQGLFSPRAVHVQFSLDYIAENLDAPTTILQYPSKRELIRELRRGYDFIGISFVLATFHRMKEIVDLVRKYSPETKIVLGGYGTVATDEMLLPLSDHICREEGVAFMRDLLGEPEIEMPYRHPVIINPLKIFGVPVSRTGVVFAGLGCPNGCDFCCTSHFFKRKHIRLLPTGKDIHNAIERYHDVDPEMAIIILDEDFLLHKKRAMELRESVLAAGKPLSIFAFGSVRALSRYTASEILEMGIDGLWIGYEGTRSGYAKLEGRPVEDIFTEFREAGITILASMIVGFPYQTPEIIKEELDGLLALRPTLTQYLIYGPCPGTPFYDRVVEEGLLEEDVADNLELFYRRGTAFHSLVHHPVMAREEIERAQQTCFEDDFRRLGPGIFRSLDTWLLGYLKHRDSENPYLRAKAEQFKRDLRTGYPVFLSGRIFGPTREVRRWIRDLQSRIHAAVGAPTLMERAQSVGAIGLAAWTGLSLKLGRFQHPKLTRHTYRMPDSKVARSWGRVRAEDSNYKVEVERRPRSTVWVRVEGDLRTSGAGTLVERLRRALDRKKDSVVLDLARLAEFEEEAMQRLAEGLRNYRDRISIVLPRIGEIAALTALFALQS